MLKLSPCAFTFGVLCAAFSTTAHSRRAQRVSATMENILRAGSACERMPHWHLSIVRYSSRPPSSHDSMRHYYHLI